MATGDPIDLLSTGAAIGIIGLGQMGTSLSSVLIAGGHRVSGFDVDDARSAALESAGGQIAGSPAELAEASTVIITSLPSAAALREVLGGPDGVLTTAGAGVVVIETSTLSLAEKEWARDEGLTNGVDVLDCPLSGTAAQAATGDVVVLASGEAAAVGRCAPVFDAIGREWFDLGVFGNGSRMKYVANLLVAVHNAAAAEALGLAARAGLDPARSLQILTAGAGTSRMLEVRGPAMVDRQFDGVGMQIKTFAKDIDIISAFAREHDCPVPLFTATERLYAAAGAQGLGELDTAAVALVVDGLHSPDLPVPADAPGTTGIQP
jgi:3-hydroxyisobutyrate dehydrogenase-like beta-hydroxyacid dehydrogenase